MSDLDQRVQGEQTRRTAPDAHDVAVAQTSGHLSGDSLLCRIVRDLLAPRGIVIFRLGPFHFGVPDSTLSAN